VKNSYRWLLRTVSAGSLCLVLGTAALAQAPQTYAFNLPQQSLSAALRDYARISGRQIIFTEDLVAGLSSRPLQGQFSAEEALRQLLAGTGLVIEYSSSGAVMIRREQRAEAPQPAPGVPAGSAAGLVGGPVETVAVTGSRIIADAANSPTPLTVVSTLQLLETTPTNIPDGLNKLPVFQGSVRPGWAGNGGSSAGINVLALRNFGAQRTLVLLDGRRLAPTNANGTVAIDTLPQMLVSRVDVVTGGASAVYGSDAVTGVVNFVLDKRYEGLKFNVNSGISNYGDAASYKAEMAFGTPLFGGKGHFLASAEYLHRDGIPQSARPYGNEYWSLTGAGTQANPRVFTKNIRNATASDGGVIRCTGCSVNEYHFIGNGVIAPFVHGTPTGTSGVESGGDGAYGPFGTAMTPYRSAAAFGRFSYMLNDTTEFYAQATGAESWATGTWYPTNMIIGANRVNTFYADNPFLSPELQARINPTNTPGKTFQLTKFINQFGREGSPGTRNVNRYLSGATGLTGVLLDRFAWDLYYTHGESRQSVTNYRNPNNQRWYAAVDAVRDPATGNIVCYVSTTVYASRYPGCKPMNPFGTSSISQESYDYISGDTQYIMTNIMDDVAASISGDLFELPAGMLKGALSAEMRWLEYGVRSNASPLDKVDCTGLRLCSTSNALWQQDTVNGLAPVGNSVWEVALELGAPLLRDLPMIRNLDINAGVRHTDYSTSGAVQTWKVGLDYHVNDDLRFRATTSVDIRAPTLNDLFSPVQSSITSFTDLLTGAYGIIPVTRQGNPNLKPEVARTYTAGVVLTPSWLDGLTFSYDYYRITIKNGIGALTAANNEIQSLCVASGGTSPYCTLYARPFPYSNTSPANYPTEIFNKSLNTAYQGIEGSDIEVNYRLDLANVSQSLPGSVDFRLMANLQPVDKSQQFTGASFTYATTPRGNVTATLSYNLDDWRFSLQNNWISSYRLSNRDGYIVIPARVGAQNYIDFSMQRRFTAEGGSYTAYLTVQNLLNTHTPLHPGGSGSPGLSYPLAQRGDLVGRYFTIGLRGNL